MDSRAGLSRPHQLVRDSANGSLPPMVPSQSSNPPGDSCNFSRPPPPRMKANTFPCTPRGLGVSPNFKVPANPQRVFEMPTNLFQVPKKSSPQGSAHPTPTPKRKEAVPSRHPEEIDSLVDAVSQQRTPGRFCKKREGSHGRHDGKETRLRSPKGERKLERAKPPHPHPRGGAPPYSNQVMPLSGKAQTRLKLLQPTRTGPCPGKGPAKKNTRKSPSEKPQTNPKPESNGLHPPNNQG
ncbi:protein piccolo-like [Penaeus monodon]|uniref:protein piccolo-like n=1 Tax=Penaeus monodon TaxID=6687 RepID=UPI0018A73E69|nr:protein piccolo-like [Penaeus monodon]